MDINFHGPINSLGYGVVSKNIIKSLDKLGHRVTLFTMGQVQVESQEDNFLIQKMIDRQKSFSSNAPSLTIWHQFDLPYKIGNGPSYVFPIFELDRLTEREVHHLEWHDGIFTTCHWFADVLEQYPSLIGKVHIAPLGVDTDIFSPNFGLNLADNVTTFLNVGKLEVRKGHKELVEAFNRAFTEKDNVRLWMMCYNPFFTHELNNGRDLNKEFIDWAHSTPLTNKIDFLIRVSTQKDLASIMCGVDCGVFPAKSEGWNLDLLEMMACGRQVICTNYSGHTAFCNKQNASLIEIDTEEDAQDGKWFHGQGKWACLEEYQITKLVEYMRNIHDKQKSRGRGSLFNAKGVETAQKFTWENTAQQIVKVLQK